MTRPYHAPIVLAQISAKAPATAAASGARWALALSATALPVAAGAPELVGLPVLPVWDEEAGVEVWEAPVEMGVSPAGMLMKPVTVEREGSVMMEAMDSEMGRGRGTGVPKLALGVLEPGRVSAWCW